ncbi:hypothetical protein LYSIN_01201 [Lysinibacillus sphaericus]|uniref:Uncharacterized protein n=1 Tax=Lysinibacillus sphaericus TaxID=1421 RepID=A0A2S5D098_LYSSH|nr:hypothetical protein LYSIN_01201 [Lysinibacillus sphaericus]
MSEQIKNLEEYYSSHLETENKEEFEKVISNLYSELRSLDAYNLLV